MRPVAILSVLLALLVGLALTPNSAAAPPSEPCNGTFGKHYDVGPATLFVSPPCYTVELEAMSCPLAGSWKQVQVDSVTVRYYTCDSPATSSAVLVPPVCLWKEVASGPVKAGADLCRESHETFPACSSAQRIHHYEQVGAVYAQADVCFPHSPPPALAASAVELPNPCGPDANCQGPECPPESFETSVDHRNSVTLGRDCTVDVVTGEGQICVGAWSGHERREVGPITWDRYYCDFPGGSPIGDLTMTSAAPSPIASDHLRIVFNPDGTVDVLVKVDVMDCLWGEGYQKTAEAGPVTLWVWGCEPYPPYETMAAADPFPTCVTEPCGPSAPVPDGCDLQDATPTSFGPTGLDLQRLVWGSDTSQCDVDVEPIGACAPPSGSTIERRVLFVHLILLVCGGGIGDGWS